VIEGPTAAADAIIVAAGSSSRMAGVDKLLAEVGGGRTLLGRTIDAFAALPSGVGASSGTPRPLPAAWSSPPAVTDARTASATGSSRSSGLPPIRAGSESCSSTTERDR
jgi:molybdopterin-guanine dinucleotide biosynthesis protein A